MPPNQIPNIIPEKEKNSSTRKTDLYLQQASNDEEIIYGFVLSRTVTTLENRRDSRGNILRDRYGNALTESITTYFITRFYSKNEELLLRYFRLNLPRFGNGLEWLGPVRVNDVNIRRQVNYRILQVEYNPSLRTETVSGYVPYE